MSDINTNDIISLTRTTDYLRHRMKIESEYEEILRDFVIKFLEHERSFIR